MLSKSRSSWLSTATKENDLNRNTSDDKFFSVVDVLASDQKVCFYAPQLYRQVLLRRVLAMGILSVRLSVRLSVTTRWYTKTR